MTKLISWNVNSAPAQASAFGIFPSGRCRCVSACRRAASRQVLEPGFAWILSVLELCREKGYSGTALFTRQEPLSVTYGIAFRLRQGGTGDYRRSRITMW